MPGSPTLEKTRNSALLISNVRFHGLQVPGAEDTLGMCSVEDFYQERSEAAELRQAANHTIVPPSATPGVHKQPFARKPLRSADTEVTDVTTEALEEDMERVVGDFQFGCLKFV